jgi:hypothetical protein
MSATNPIEPKPWASQLETKLFDALDELWSARNIYANAAGEDAKFTLKDAETILKAEKLRYEAMLAYRNERLR